ncbi:MAG: LON peptidase substrate-binding domain-containing protein, partial [Fimbriimonadaceae bacterium]
MADVKLPVEEEDGTAEADIVQPINEQDLEEQNRPDIPDELNILPLRDSVIYPMLIAPLSVSRQSSMQLIDESLGESNRIIGVVAQKNAETEDPSFEDVYDTGCAVIVRTLVKMPDSVRLIVQGIVRFKIVEVLQEEPFLRAKIEVIEDDSIPEEKKEEFEALRRSIASLFDQAIRHSQMLPDELRSLTESVSEPPVMTDLVAAHMPMSVENKQTILEAYELEDRMRKLLEMLGKEVRVLELSTKVQSQVSAELSRTQREYYLREQLKAIQRELGEYDDSDEDAGELRKRIEELDLPQEARREANRELDRLKRINPGSPEYSVARTYLETITALPWNTSSEDTVDLKRVREVLDRDHFGLEKIKQRIVEFLAVRKVKGEGPIRQPILCFAGPPGVGKTSLGQSIAHAMNREFVRLSLGGVRDEAEIRGHRRTYIGAMPGQIMQSLRRTGTNNPVLMLDEIDKL